MVVHVVLQRIVVVQKGIVVLKVYDRLNEVNVVIGVVLNAKIVAT